MSLFSRMKNVVRREPIVWNAMKQAQSLSFGKAIKGIGIFLSGRGCVVSANELGVSNRIKCLLSTMRLADMLKKDVIVYWPRNWACRCDFADLFENHVFEIDSEGFERLAARANSDNKIEILDTWGALLSVRGDLGDGFPNRSEQDSSGMIDFEYEKISLKAKEAYLRYVRTLRPNSYIRDEVARFAEHFDKSTVSVSIRSWVECEERATSLFRIENVFHHMDKCAGSFFVSCDSMQVLESLRGRYGARVLTYPKRTVINDRRSREGMQDILIDMLLLGKNSRMIASYLSTYPEVAWWLGGCTGEVELIEDQEKINEWKCHHQQAIRSKIGKRLEKLDKLLTDNGYQS